MKKLTFLLTLSALFLIGCTTEEISTLDSSIENDSYAKGIANAPEKSGMYVIRTESVAAGLIVDAKTGLSVLFGVDFVAFCSSEPNFNDVVSTQYVDVQSNDERFLALQQGDVITFVFDGIFDGSKTLCDFVFSTPILAEGVSRFIYNDNDINGTVDNNSNSWSLKLNGRLLNQYNESKNLSAKFHETWDKEHHWSFSSSVRLH